MLKKQIRTCSPVMDVNTPGVWQLFSATDWNVSDTYEKMHECGIPIENQRTGSLLNYCAVRSVGTIKTLEPEMYAKINSRFNNVDFIASFSKSGYYNIAKPKDIAWSGGQHIKAGMKEGDVKKLTDRYEYFLNKLGLVKKEDFEQMSPEDQKKHFLSNAGIYGYRDGNVFKFERSLELTKKLGSALAPINPFQFYFEETDDLEVAQNWDEEACGEPYTNDRGLSAVEVAEMNRLSVIHTTWEEYCLYLLNTSDDPAKSIWREKLITSILSWKYSEGSVEPSTIDALDILSEISPYIVAQLEDDVWTKDDYHTGGILPISGKTCLSLSHYPQQSLEKEAQECIDYILDNGLFSEIEKSLALQRVLKKFAETEVWSMLTPTQWLMVHYGNDAVKKKNKVDENTEKRYDDIISLEDVLAIVHDQNRADDWRNYEKVKIWMKRIKDGNEKWFREAIHSTSSWKRFTINILKGDITCKYLGFGPCATERIARANAMQAFSQKQEEKEKAKKEAEKMAKQIEAERKQSSVQ